jgi:hypothetical protein
MERSMLGAFIAELVNGNPSEGLPANRETVGGEPT